MQDDTTCRHAVGKLSTQAELGTIPLYPLVRWGATSHPYPPNPYLLFLIQWRRP